MVSRPDDFLKQCAGSRFCPLPANNEYSRLVQEHDPIKLVPKEVATLKRPFAVSDRRRLELSTENI